MSYIQGYPVIKFSIKGGGVEFSLPNHPALYNLSFDDNNICANGYYLGFESGVDISLLLANLGEDWNFSALQKHNANYLLIIKRKINNTYYVITDNRGSFPLYYSLNTNELVCSPVLTCVIKDTKQLKVSSKSLLSHYLFSDFLSGRTLFTNVCSLPPGHVLEMVVGGEIKIRPPTFYKSYNRVDLTKYTPNSFSELYIGSLKRLAQEYDKALKPELPINFDVSSGLDSSLVSQVFCKELTRCKNQSYHTTFYNNEFSMYSEKEPLIRFVENNLSQPLVVHNKELFNDYRKMCISDHEMQYTTIDLFEFKRYLNNLKRNPSGGAYHVRGLGGDEVYVQGKLSSAPFYIMHHDYFSRLMLIKELRSGLLSSYAQELYLDKSDYSSLVVTDLDNGNLQLRDSLFQAYWDAAVWPIHPFFDLRIKFITQSLNRLYGDREIRSKVLLPFRGVYFSDDHFNKDLIQNYTPLIVKSFEENKQYIYKLFTDNSIFKSNLFGEPVLKSLFNDKPGKLAKDYRSLQLLFTIVNTNLYLKWVQNYLHKEILYV